MRIRDWSSDVCASDLARRRRADDDVQEPLQPPGLVDRSPERRHGAGFQCETHGREISDQTARLRPAGFGFRPEAEDRKSVVYAKRVSVRVDLCGRRSMKNKP